jgi:hypothetical protein
MLLLGRLGFVRQLADDIFIQHTPRMLRMNGAELVRRVLACVQCSDSIDRPDESALFAVIDG